MFEVIRTRFDDYTPIRSDIIRFEDDYDTLVRFVRRMNEMHHKHGFPIILTFRERANPLIRTIDRFGHPLVLNGRKGT